LERESGGDSLERFTQRIARNDMAFIKKKREKSVDKKKKEKEKPKKSPKKKSGNRNDSP